MSSALSAFVETFGVLAPLAVSVAVVALLVGALAVWRWSR